MLTLPYRCFCRYFPASATQEMLDEFRPQLCPFNSANMMSALAYLEMFLPICVKPEEAPISYGLWFEEFMDLWNVCHNASSWERVSHHLSYLKFQYGLLNMNHTSFACHYIDHI